MSTEKPRVPIDTGCEPTRKVAWPPRLTCPKCGFVAVTWADNNARCSRCLGIIGRKRLDGMVVPVKCG